MLLGVEYELGCCSDLFVFAMPTPFSFVCVLYSVAVALFLCLCDPGFLCTLFPCMVQQQFGHVCAQSYVTLFKFCVQVREESGLL